MSTMQTAQSVIFLQLCTQPTLPITISPPSLEPHPLELEVEKTKQLILQKREAANASAVHEDASTAPESQENILTTTELLPLSLSAINSGSDVGITGLPSTTDMEDDPTRLCPIMDDEPDPQDNNNPDEKQMAGTQCHLCNKLFLHKKNLYAHMRDVHSCEPTTAGGLICPLCRMNFIRHAHLRHHFQSLHHIHITQLEHRFTTMTEFEEWKELIEEQSDSYYISKCAAQTLAQNQTKKYFKCHRSGNNGQLKSSQRLKSKTSIKIGATCPAGMEVTESADHVHVVYWPTHVGHHTNRDTAIGSISLEVKSSTTRLQPALSSKEGKRKGGVRGNRKAKRHTSSEMLIDKAQHVVQLLENGDVEPATRSLISDMLDNVRFAILKKYKKHHQLPSAL